MSKETELLIALAKAVRKLLPNGDDELEAKIAELEAGAIEPELSHPIPNA